MNIFVSDVFFRYHITIFTGISYFGFYVVLYSWFRGAAHSVIYNYWVCHYSGSIIEPVPSLNYPILLVLLWNFRSHHIFYID